MNQMTTKLLQQTIAKKFRKNSKKDGFTLVELLIVIVIIGVLSGVALPNFLKSRDKAKVAAANASAAALMTSCEVAITSDSDVTTDEDVTRLAGALPAADTDPQAYVTATLTSPDICSVTITGTAVGTDGEMEAFGVKTPAVPGTPAGA